jgi:hypothetical protein
MAKTDLTKSLLSRFDRLKAQRQNWETHWQEVADYMQPRKADVTRTRSKGDKRTELIFDSSPIQAVELLAASLHGMLTNPSTPWFSLRFKNSELEMEDEAKLWLENATEVMYTAFNRSNFQQEIFELYHDLITFGTAAMFIQEDNEDILKFSTRHINEIFIAEDDKGKIDTVYRKFKLSVRAAIQQFGNKISTDIQAQEKKDPYNEIEILHVVYPRSDFDPNKKDTDNMPFESVYIEMKNGNELSVSGFQEFPFVVPRYLKASHEIYGRSPAMTALPDVKKMRLLGPVLGRLQSELLKPMIDRCFNILFRREQFAPAPEFLSGQDIEIEYVSPLAKAQKSSELSSITRGIEILGSLANVAPVFDYINFDALVKHVADLVGVPQKVLKLQSQVNSEREQAAQQQQQMAQMQQLQQVAKAGGDIAPLAKALPEEARAVANSEVE